jgi:hypothetical protein
MLHEAQVTRNAYLKMLKDQAYNIIDNHFMIESKEEDDELAEIDGLMMMVTRYEQSRDNPAATVINTLNKLLKDKTIADIKK